MQYSLHLQFSNPSKGKNCTNVELNKECGYSPSYNKEKKICEKCNYVHLVHCPINDLICHTKKKKTRYIEKSSSKIDSRLQNSHNKDIVCDKKCLDKNDKIKIEG